jgi:5-formyltetrahydrofolate cyclo-ligase
MPLIEAQAHKARGELRRALRERRLGLAPETIEAASAAAARHLVASPEFAGAQSVAGYVAVRGEADPRTVLEAASAHGKSVYLPCVRQNDRLVFARWRPGELLRAGRFGIPEPAPGREAFAAKALDVVIVPLLGFDAAGNRIGSGAGYYDRGFAFKLESAAATTVLVGFAYAWQQCSAIAAQAWDVALDLVVTEHGITRFTAGGR